MTIGNLPKDIRCKPSRRGQILLAYLPTSRLLHIKSKAARRRTLANLFHACLSRVVQPLIAAGLEGVPIASGDGVYRRGHPIVAVYVGDYPEQVLVTGCKTGECPKCPVPKNELGATTDSSRPFRPLDTVLDALATLDDGPRAYTAACRDAGIKPLFHPFWEELPYTNIFYAITPDILHQLYQGVMKHLIGWLKDAFGAEELDVRCRRLPRNHSLRHFEKGISKLTRVTGKEHRDMCRILLGLIIGLPLPNGVSASRLVRATRAMLDFLYYAQYPTHTTTTLTLLDNALKAFHANKGIFIDLGIREHFRLPKLHSLDHYRRAIEMFGMTDNYDTQYTERLHIDFAKDAYRASNKKDELSQMTSWLERREKVQRHEKYVQWQLAAQELERACTQPTHHTTQPIPAISTSTSAVPGPSSRTLQPRAPTSVAGPSSQLPIVTSPENVSKPRIKMTRHPSVKSVKFRDAVAKYSATFFRDALARFTIKYNTPSLTPHEIERHCAGLYFGFSAIAAYHKIKVNLPDVHGLGIQALGRQDVIHVRPERKDKYGRTVPGRFDTALVRVAHAGMETAMNIQSRFQLACHDTSSLFGRAYFAFTFRVSSGTSAARLFTVPSGFRRVVSIDAVCVTATTPSLH